MKIDDPYGLSTLSVSIPEQYQVDIIEAPQVPATKNPIAAVQAALDSLLSEVEWPTFAAAKSVAIAINDNTRPVPHDQLLPPLLARLNQLGIPDDAITFFIAVGTHPPMHPEKFPTILPTHILKRYQVVSHDAEDQANLIFLGDTPLGTPIWTNGAYYQSDLKIVVGNIEPHQFVGFSGGVKTAAIGLAGFDTINHNHALMTNPSAQLGEYQSNPARQDIEAIGKKVGVHLAVNAILNQKKQIVQVLAGDPVAVMEAGIPLSRNVCQIAVQRKYPLVIASPGGHPKDINVYQSQKALGHASLITQLGGTVIIAASCPEGAGSPHYIDWMKGKNSHEEVIQRIEQEGFRIGPHKAFQIARDALRFHVMIYSNLDKDVAKRLLLDSAFNFQKTVDSALMDLQPGDRIGVLPHASSTIPYYENARGD